MSNLPEIIIRYKLTVMYTPIRAIDTQMKNRPHKI
jgi:hypothetical protein